MNENDFMVFEEASTGKWLVVERSDDQYEFNSYLFDKNKEFAASKKLSLLFDKSVSAADDGLGKACDVAMEMFGIDKTDIYVAELSNIEQELESVKSPQEIAKLHSALKDALKEVAVPLEKIDFTRNNYNKLFPYSKIETPIESVKMGANQFEKLEARERQNLLLAVHDTLKNPDLIISEQKENVFGEQEDNHIYAKSFLIDDKVHGLQSVVVSIDGENVSISTHERSVNNIVNKIKKPDQLLYAAAKVRLLAERATGKQLVTVNPIRENEYVVSPTSNIQQQSQSVKLPQEIAKLHSALKDALKEVAVPLEKIDFTRNNYNKLFPEGRINTPIENVKMGEHQFEKLEAKQREFILQATHNTLKSPDLIINEQKENVFGEQENSHIYAKSFLINDKVHGLQSVVVSIDGENVSISTHERDINNFVNKIKKPDQILYAAAKVRLLVEQHTEIPQLMVNPTREFEYVKSLNSNIQQQSESVKSPQEIAKLQSALKDALKEVAVPLEKIDFTKENYNNLFPRSRIETPIENVKLGANQFEKLEIKERQNLLLAVHNTLKNPDLIINEQKENVFGEQEDNHIYAKSFLIDDKVHGLQSVVVSIDGENVSISTHERSINNIVNKIKKPDQLLYAAAKVRLLVEQHTEIPQSVVNPIRENEYVVSPTSNIQQQSESVKSPQEIATELVLEKLKQAKINVITEESSMQSILNAGIEVQKMAAHYGTNQNIENPESFNGYGVYVLSVNEENAKTLGLKIASKKYGDSFYINNQPLQEFLQEQNFSSYWQSVISQIQNPSNEKLLNQILTSDLKGNPALVKEQAQLSTLCSLNLINYKREQTYLYSVEIPDNDGTNYLFYDKTIGLESANRINDELKKIGSEWKVSRNDTGNSVYFNILSDKVFHSQKQASEFLQKIGYVGMETSGSNYIIFDDREMNINNRVQYMMSENGEVYGFAYNGEIYADKNLMNSNVLAHEYTHLWDNYTKNANPELWERGKNVFKQTNIWNEVVNDPSYQNIKNNEDEILSECHARICGKFAQQVLERIAAENGENAKNAVIDWDSEVNSFIATEFGFAPELGSENYVSDSIKAESLKEFLATPMKDLMAGRGFENRLEREPLNINQEHSKFDEELYLFNNGQLDENHIFNLGIPGEILKNCGFPENDRIELAASRLKIKASQGNHPFEIMDILGLDKALQNPIAVFEYGDKEKSQNVIVNLEKDGKNFLVGVFFNQKKDGFEVSSIRGLFNRDNLDWMRWIQQGKMIYGDKERIQVLANQQRTNLADVNSKEARSSSDLYYLDSLNNILQNFSDVKNIYTKDFPKYAEQKEKFEIFKQFRSAYQETDSINVYDAVKDADEFYEAIKNNDKSIIEKFTNGIEKAELAKAASLILQNRGSHVRLKGINTQALNSNYNKDKLLSTKEIESLNNRETSSPQFMKSAENKNQELEQEELSSYIGRFENATQGKSNEIQLQKSIELALEKNAIPLTEVKLNRENWNKFFPNGTVETPIGTVKLGENQFEKLQKEDRNNLLAAMYETLSNPAVILEKETLDKNSGDFKPVNVYGKSFVREDSNHKKIVESVVIFKDGDEISIGTHNKELGRFSRQIKTADQIIFADSEISRVASLILQNGGSHVQLKGINTQALNSNYNKDKLLSTKEIESLNNRENSSPQFMKSADNKNQELEQEDYIHSEEFIEKFGDWEKANRIEKLKNAESLTKDDKIFSAGEDITKTVESLVENEDRKSIQSIEKELGKNIVGTYINRDTGLSINVSNRNVTEISNHHYLQKEHIQAIQYIPEIIDRAVFIGDVGNEDKKKHPNIQKYKYFATGLNLNGNDFTCKTVVGVDKSGNCYYDQSLSSIEKGKLIDIIQEKNKLGNLSPLITQRESEPNKPETVNLVNTKDSFEPLENKSPSAYYDKRLINICQVPQMSYLEMKNGKWQPKEESVQAVKEGKLFIEKNGQNYIMRDEKQLSTPQFMKSADNKNQELEQEDYIHSEEFIAKFGDWKKAERLEKLRNSESVGISGNEILQAEDLKEYKNNAIQYGKSLRGEYKNIDSGNEILLTASKKGGGIYEILEHDYKDKEHLQSIAAIPQIIENSIYISSEKNEDVQKHPNIDSYEYYLCGLKIANNDYTVKAVVAKTLDGNRYYDHKLTDIEKGKLLDFMKKYSVQTSSVSITTQTPETERFQLKDKRLYQICQCPQINYLNKNLEPTEETIQAVKDGKLYVEKDENGIQILHDENKGLTLGKELSEIFKNQEKHYQSVPEWKKTLNNLMEMAKNEENEKSQNHENESELSQWYETVDWEDPIESAEAWQNGTQEQIDYIRKRQNEIIDNGIESLQENGGMSDAIIKADIEKSEISEEQSDESEILFDDTNGKPHYPQEIISALENFQRIESSKWNLKTEEKTAVFHLIQITEIEKNDFENSLEKLRNYMNSEEFKKEEGNYAKILTPILLTSLGQDFDEKTHTFSSTKFSYKFSTDELKKEVPVEKGEIKSVLGNDFTGGNAKLTQEFQNELIEKGIVKPEEDFILINEVEAVAYGTKVKENEPFVTLTIPVDNDGKTEFIQTKYYHVSSLEEPQKTEKIVEENAKEADKADKNIIIYGKTKVPEFAMITQHGLENFKDMIIESYEESTKTYLLKSEDNNKNVRISENTLNVLTSKDYAQKAKNYTQDTKTAEKMVETQYEDFFKLRSNCANNFRHNLAIFCRKEANSPLDALKLANSLISQMPNDEKRKTKELLNLLKKDGQSVNEVIIETYHEAVKEVPLNEDYLNNKRYEKMIARPMYDTISTKGEKIDRDFNLKIGDSVQMSFKVNKNPLSKFSLRKENLNQNCTIISASKEGNLVTVMDGNKSFYDVPRDTFLKEYAKKQKVENKMEKKVHRQMSMQIDIGR